MVSLVTDYIQDTAAKYLGVGITAVGSLAGNAVGGVGGLIENSGRAVGNGVSGGIGGIGGYINGYGDSLRGSMAPDGPVRGTTHKTAVKQVGPASSLQNKRPVSKAPSLPANKTVTNKSVPKTPSTKSLPVAKGSLPASTLSSARTPAASAKKNSNGKVTISPESRPAAKSPALQKKTKTMPPSTVRLDARASTQTKASPVKP